MCWDWINTDILKLRNFSRYQATTGTLTNYTRFIL